ncbi:MAG: hypothetical protein KDB07_00925 [Planctomycetes bacterium]|nr:hypothetical protein [Planctomycetota bacterium]
MAKVFVSLSSKKDKRAFNIVRLLKEAGHEVQHSPCTDPLHPDPRWETWLGDGLAKAIAWAEYFVAIESKNMPVETFAHAEYADALTYFKEFGKPKLFMSREGDKQLPIGWEDFGTRAKLLPTSAGGAATAVIEYDRAAKDLSKKWKH